MYIDNENFEKWMEKLSKKLTEIGENLKSLINTDKALDDNEKKLDNQDLAFLSESMNSSSTYTIYASIPTTIPAVFIYFNQQTSKIKKLMI